MAIAASTPPFERSFWCDVADAAGVNAVDLVASAIVRGAFAWGATQDFFVLLVDGEPVASCAAYAAHPGSAAPLKRDRLLDLLAHIGTSVDALMPACEVYDALWADADKSPFAKAPATWIIENVGVAHARRGEGLLRTLIAAAMARGIERGHDTVGLGLVVGNDHAQRAYEHLGFSVSKVFGPDAFVDNFPGLIKMTRTLPIGIDPSSQPRTYGVG